MPEGDAQTPDDGQIPDDARELEPDRRAYYRELRFRRWLGPTGLVLIVAIFMVTLATTMMLSFMPSGGEPPAVPPTPEPTREIAPDEAVGEVGAPLPNLRLRIGPAEDRLRNIENPAILLLGAADCGCDAFIARLARVARHPHGVAVYSAGHAPIGPIPIVHVDDPEGALGRAYDAKDLTAVLIDRDGLVHAVRTDLRRIETLEPLLPELHR